MAKNRVMSSKLYKFLESRKVVGKDKPFTHTEFGGNYGKYYVDDADYDEFLSAYADAVKNTGPQYLIEYPKEIGPLCIDLDFNFAPEERYEKRQYKEKHVKAVINYINDIVKRYTKAKPSQIKAYVTEKPKPSTDYDKNTKSLKRYKDGLHIMYPNLRFTKDMRYLVIDMCQNMVDENGDFKDIDFTNPLEDVFDKRIVAKNGFVMYGSKKQTGQLYSLTKVYNSEGKRIKFKTDGLERVLSIRKFIDEEPEELQNTEEEMFRLAKQKASAKTGSGRSGKKDNKIIKKVIIEEDDNDFDDFSDDGGLSDSDSDSDSEDEDEYIEGHIDEREKDRVEKLINILDPRRAYSYDTWTEVGWCLRNIDKRLLPLFKKFSKDKLEEYLKKNPGTGRKQYDPKGCEKLWTNARKDGKRSTIKSLCHWANTDNYDRYMDIIRSYARKELFLADSGTHYDVAKVIHKIYQSRYVCVSIAKNKWYEFQNHRWILCEAGHTLLRDMSEELVTQICSVSTVYMAQCQNNRGSDRDEILQKNDRLIKLIDKLKNTAFKRSVLAECANLFYDPKFEEKLDSDRDLLGFDNGVYDLSRGIFREGVPEDYITFSVGYRYKEYSTDHRYIKDIKDFFSKVQPDSEMREYILSLFASHLDGHNKQQRFILFTGFKGSNGKSTIVDFLTKILGDYASSVPHTLLTRKRGSAGAATPELADKRGIRFIQINEPSKSDEIEVGYMKLLTGNDQIEARALYGEMFYFKPQFKFVFICNKLPKVDSSDGGTWRRIRAVPFEVEFLDKGSKIRNPKMQFYKDSDIDNKMDKWKRVFMWYLLKEYYPKYRENGVYEPEKVVECTQKYKKDSDFIFDFLSATVELTKDDKDYESMTEICNDFRTYVQQWWNGGSNRPSKKDLLDYLERDGFTISGGKIKGIKYKMMDDVNGMTTEFD